MKPSPRVVIAVATLLALSVAGCSSTPSGSSNTAKGTKDTFVIASAAVGGTLNPDTYDGLAQRTAMDMIMGPLVRYKDVKDVKGGSVATPSDVEPWLAKSYKLESDGIEFTLGDAESAYGNKLTPEDVVYTIDRIYKAKSALGLLMLGIAGVDQNHPAEVTGPNTVKVFAKVNYDSIATFTTYWLAPLDKVEVEKHVTQADPYAQKWLKTHSAMFGPYWVGDGVGSFTPEKELRLAKNPHYTRQPAHFANVVLEAVPTAAGRVSLLQSGQADEITNVPYENLKVLKGVSGITLQLSSAGSQDTIALNNNLYKDVRVRQAMSYAIDRKALAQGAYQGFVKPSTSIMSTEIPADNSTADSFNYDPQKAQQLLKDANAVGTKVQIYANSTEMTASPDAVLPQVAQMLNAVGFDASTQVVASAADYRAAYSAGKYGAWIRQEGPLLADPVYFFNLFYVKGASSDFGAVNLPQINDSVAQAVPLLNDQARKQAMAPAIKAANDQQVSLPLVESVSGYAFAKGICPAPLNKTFLVNPAAATTC